MSFYWIFLYFVYLFYKSNYFTWKKIVTNLSINYLNYTYFYVNKYNLKININTTEKQ